MRFMAERVLMGTLTWLQKVIYTLIILKKLYIINKDSE